MKRLYGAVALLILTGIATTVSAADCRVNGGNWQHVGAGGTLNLQVPVTVRVSPDSTRLLLEGANLACRFTPGQPFPTFFDIWRTSALAGAPWTPGPKFVSQGTGLRINGTHHNTPVPYELHLALMPNNSIGVPIDVTPYILLRNNPTNPIDIRTGDTLGALRLRQTNNYSPTSTVLVLTYTAANNFTVSPSTCTINNNNPIEINFGNVNQREIGTDPLTTPIRSNRRLTYSCPAGGITSPITITYKGMPSSFDSRLLRMTNTDVGTALIRAGSAVQVNGRFLTQITNSVGGDDVTFTLVHCLPLGPLPGAAYS
jgi:type 1 fimbria pilin